MDLQSETDSGGTSKDGRDRICRRACPFAGRKENLLKIISMNHYDM